MARITATKDEASNGTSRQTDQDAVGSMLSEKAAPSSGNGHGESD